MSHHFPRAQLSKLDQAYEYVTQDAPMSAVRELTNSAPTKMQLVFETLELASRFDASDWVSINNMLRERKAGAK